MSLSEKLKKDQEMVSRAIVFFVDGTFYAAYERSAFLASRLLPPLKVTCRFRKAVEQTVAQVGFPASSLPKFAADLRIEQQAVLQDVLRRLFTLLRVVPQAPFAPYAACHEQRVEQRLTALRLTRHRHQLPARETRFSEDAEQEAHQVTLSSYHIGETEVTQALWEAVMGSNPSRFKGANRPVEQVNRDDCQIFIGKLNSLTGKTFRLPSEAEWEFAARGGTKSRGYKYSGSNNLTTVSWYTDNSGNETHPVKKKKPNELGIYDMSGNVWEWCQDGMQTYISTPQTNPIGENTDSARLLRGGSCINSATTCRVANRFADKGSYRTFGFRLALFSLFQNGIHR